MALTTSESAINHDGISFVRLIGTLPPTKEPPPFRRTSANTQRLHLLHFCCLWGPVDCRIFGILLRRCDGHLRIPHKMNDGQDPLPPGDPEPQQKKQKKIVLPKRKRRFTPVLKKKPESSSEFDAEDEPPAAAAETSSVLRRATTSGASRKLSNAELKGELQRLNGELSQSQVFSLSREVESLRKHNKTLTEAFRKARDDLRAQKKESTTVEKANKRKLRDLEASAEDAQVVVESQYKSQLEAERVSFHIVLFVL